MNPMYDDCKLRLPLCIYFLSFLTVTCSLHFESAMAFNFFPDLFRSVARVEQFFFCCQTGRNVCLVGFGVPAPACAALFLYSACGCTNRHRGTEFGELAHILCNFFYVSFNCLGQTADCRVPICQLHPAG